MVGSPGFLPPEILAPGWYDPMRGTSQYQYIGRRRVYKDAPITLESEDLMGKSAVLGLLA